MNEEQVPERLTREEAKYYILLTLDRFKWIMVYLNDNKSKLPTISNINKQLPDLLYELERKNFYLNLIYLVSSDVFEVLTSESLREFLLKCKDLSEKFNLNIKFPSNITVVTEIIIKEFMCELTEESLSRLRFNLEEIQKTKELLLSQVENVNINRENKNELETILAKRQEYDIAKNNYLQAAEQMSKLTSLYSFNRGEYQRYSQVCKENKEVMDTILCEYPLVNFFYSKTDKNYLKKKINNTFSDICKAINKTIEKIQKGQYPIWHFDALITELLQKYDSKETEVIKDYLAKKRKKEELIDLSITIGSITLSVLMLLIPSGAVASLLYVKTRLQIVNAAASVVSAVNDISDSLLYKQEALSHIKVSPEIKELMRAENINLSDAQSQLLLALVSSALVIFDIRDAKKSVELLEKLGDLQDVAVDTLRHSKRFGEKVLQNVDVAMINYIGKTEKAVKVFDNLSTLDAAQMYKALNFFPNNLNTNVIWLGMDNINAKTVLTSGEAVCNKYNSIILNEDLAVNFSDRAKDIEEKLNKLLHTRDIQLVFTPSEKIALLRETLPPSEKLLPKTTYIRVQTKQWTTFAEQKKPFAWVTDPYVLAGNDLPNDFRRSVGISETEEIIPDDKIWLDLVVFKDADTAKKYVPDKIIDWEMITKELETVINTGNADALGDLISAAPELLTKDNKFDARLFKDKYLDYFMNRHIPGTEYKNEFKELGNFISQYTGASNLFTGSGVTVSSRGLENIERGFTRYKDYNIAAMRDYKNMKIFRFEVYNDTSKKIKRVYVREVK